MRSYRFAYLGLAVTAALTSCGTPPPQNGTTYDKISADLKEATDNRAVVAQKQNVLQSLLPPLSLEMPQAPAIEPGQRFDLSVVSAPAQQVLSAIVSGTRYSMVVHPDIKAVISLNLKQVTLLEVLNSVREIYGYDYRIDGTRIYVLPPTLQTRIFKIDYLTTRRRGSSEMRVSSNSINNQQGGTQNTGGAVGQTGVTNNQAGGAFGQGGNQPSTLDVTQSTQIGTTSSSDFWTEVRDTVAVLAGCRVGIRPQQVQQGAAQQQQVQQQRREEILCEGNHSNHKVVISPQSGTVLVYAMPDELKSIAEYLRVSQNAVERQVLIEAKIVEVTLKDGYETGINWARFFTPQNSTVGIGQLNAGTQLGTTQTNSGLQSGFTALPSANSSTTSSLAAGNATTALSALSGIGQILSTGATGASLFGIAFQGANFAALLTFLESQGVVHTLSSPRIATMNNEKAVLKVGSDSLFVTKITGGTGAAQGVTTVTNTITTTAPTFEFTSFFSGIALDVTPRINDDGSIVLHVRPSISNVTQNLSTFNLGSLGTFIIPLVSNAVSETDSVIRAHDGQIVAIGGLMRQAQNENRNQVPGLGSIPYAGAAFRNLQQASEKRELVILLKPTVVNSDANWAQEIRNSRERVQALDRGYSWGTRSEVFGTQGEERRP